MIDFIKYTFECDHDPIGKNYMMQTTLDDLSEENLIGFCTGKDVKGKYGSNLKIRTCGGIGSNIIEVSGNPTKFLQAHNLYGSNNILHIVNSVNDKLLQNKSLSLKPTEDQLIAMKNGVIKMTRVDINRNFHLPSHLDVRRCLTLAENKMTMLYHGKPSNYNGTLYFSKESKHFEIKFYAKGDEILANKSLPRELQTPEMLDYANKTLRFEVRLNAKYLNENNLSYCRNWHVGKADEILDCLLEKITVADNLELSDKNFRQLSRCYRDTYNMWKQGYDMKKLLSRNTFYRHHNHLLAHGIDIKTVMPKFENVTIPMKDVFNNIANIPDWAYEQGLVA